jgi:hypothetical protein
MKKLYVVYQEVNNNYDTYDSMVVCAESEEEARKLSPTQYFMFDKCFGNYHVNDETSSKDSYWATVEDVKVIYIGIADETIPKGVVIASYNAG